MIDVVNQPNKDTPPPMRGTLAVLMWACFLGCSWTWVIGMFLPVLLVRDYGLWGWVAFAVPNVLGAAAMGTVLKNPEASRRIVQKHRSACLAFSQITIAFQIYMVTAFTGLTTWPTLIIIAMAFWMVGRGGSQRDPVTAAAVWIGSLAAFIYMQSQGWLWLEVPEFYRPYQLSTTHLLMFIPASVFGFALCPYLDLTFHRARQATDPMTGRVVFTLGFGVVFFSMIVFSLGYAGALLFFPGSSGPNPSNEIFLNAWHVFKWHLLIQAGFTIAVHWRSIDSTTCGYNLGRKLTLAGIAGVLAAVAFSRSLEGFIEFDQGLPIMSLTELGYRLFLLLYGTVFPIYVFLCMIPTYRQVPYKSKLIIFVPTALLSYLLAYQAFIVNRSLWALAIFAMIVIARLAIEWLPVRRD